MSMLNQKREASPAAQPTVNDRGAGSGTMEMQREICRAHNYIYSIRYGWCVGQCSGMMNSPFVGLTPKPEDRDTQQNV